MSQSFTNLPLLFLLQQGVLILNQTNALLCPYGTINCCINSHGI